MRAFQGQLREWIRLATLIIVMSICSARAQSSENADICSSPTNALRSTTEEFRSVLERFGHANSAASEKPMQEPIVEIPQITLREKTWPLIQISVSLVPKDLDFSTPKVVAKQVKAGQYPEFRCTGLPGVSCTTAWHDIVTNVPQVVMDVTHETVTVPEMTISDSQLTLLVPVSEARRVPSHSGFNTSQVLIEQTNQYRLRSASLTIDLLDCLQSYIANHRSSEMSAVDQAVGGYDAAIKPTETHNKDSVISTKNGQLLDLASERQNTVDLKSKISHQYDQIAADLNEGREKVIKQLLNSSVSERN